MEFPEGDSIDDNVWTRKFLEDLNIQVKYLWSTSEQQYGQKVNVAIASNDLPDLILVNGAQLQLMYENGQLMDVTDIVERTSRPLLGRFSMETAVFQSNQQPLAGDSMQFPM